MPQAETRLKERLLERSPIRWWTLSGLIFCLVAGIIFRFVNLDGKPYWNDEARTSQKTFGARAPQLLPAAFEGSEVTVAEIMQCQTRSSRRGVAETVSTLAACDPKHPPLYFVLARLWAELAGDSIAAMRSLPAALSVLALPCAYWLTMELFGSVTTAGLVVIIVALSPMHLVYAQEARQYSLWIVTILASSAALLRARRLGDRANWALYAFLLAAAFYTHLLSVLVAASHALYTAIIERCRWNRITKGYLLAVASVALLILPWAVVMSCRTDAAQPLYPQWTASPMPLSIWLKGWEINLSRLFFDVIPSLPEGLTRALRMLLVALEIGAIYFIWRTTERRVWLFLILLVSGTALSLSFSDLLSGGWRAVIGRYELPAFLGIQIAVAYLLSRAAASGKPYRRLLAFALGGALLSLETASCLALVTASDWWNKFGGEHNRAAAAIVNRAPSTLLVMALRSDLTGQMLSLSHYLRPDVRLKLITESQVRDLTHEHRDVFLFRPARSLKQAFEERGFAVVPLDSHRVLFRLVYFANRHANAVPGGAGRLPAQKRAGRPRSGQELDYGS